MPRRGTWGGPSCLGKVCAIFLLAVALISGAGAVVPVDPASQAIQQGTNFQPDQLDLPRDDLPLSVHLAFQLLAVHSINDEKETFSFSGLLTLKWRDPRQVFDPEIAGVSEKIFHGAYQFNELSPAWYPQVILGNATEVGESQGVLLRVLPDGSSTLVQTITAEARTRLDLRRYPFDRQSLDAHFFVLGFGADEVMLVSDTTMAAASADTTQVPQWKFEGIRSDAQVVPIAFDGSPGNTSTVKLTLEMRRLPFFMIRLVILPLIFIVALSFSVFWMDRSSLGDRMAVSFVGILTAVAYQNMVSDIMPHIAYFTLLNAIVNFSFIVMCLTVLVNLRVGALDKRGDQDQGERLDLRCRWLFPAAHFGLILVAFVFFFVLQEP